MRTSKRIRHWRHATTRTELALTLLGLGCMLILVAALVAGFTTHWL